MFSFLHLEGSSAKAASQFCFEHYKICNTIYFSGCLAFLQNDLNI